jgi:hypothetical protein
MKTNEELYAMIQKLREEIAELKAVDKETKGARRSRLRKKQLQEKAEANSRQTPPSHRLRLAGCRLPDLLFITVCFRTPYNALQSLR